MMGTPQVSIVISNFNARNFLERCLHSIDEAARSDDVSLEVIVVDDGSSDGSAAMVAEQFPRVRLLRFDANQGYARANNAGMALTSGEAVLLLNADTEVRPGALRRLVQALHTGRAIGGVGPRLLNGDGTIQQSCWRFPMAQLIGNTLFLFRLGILDDYGTQDSRRARLVDWMSSAAIMIPRRVLDDAGVFDDQFGLYGVDVDWAFRASRKGYRFLLAPDAEISHFGRSSWGDVRHEMVRDHLDGHDRFFRKHYGRPGFLLYRGTVLINSALRMAFWGALQLLDRRRSAWKYHHFRSMLRWSILGNPRLSPPRPS